MASTRKRKKAKQPAWLVGSVCAVLAVILLIALASHTQIDNDRVIGKVDPRLSPFEQHWSNQTGLLGAYLSFAGFTLLGWLIWFLPIGLLFVSIRLLIRKYEEQLRLHLILLFIICLGISIMLNLGPLAHGARYETLVGGYLTRQLTRGSLQAFGPSGSYVVLSAGILFLLLLYSSIVPLLARWIKIPGAKLFTMAYAAGPWLWRRIVGQPASDESSPETDSYAAETTDAPEAPLPDEYTHQSELSRNRKPVDSPPLVSGKGSNRKTVIKRPPEAVQIKLFDYEYPALGLLNLPPDEEASVSQEELTATSRALKETLETFGLKIDGTIDKYPGPVITRYEFKPGAGIKVNQILGLADDLALALKAKRIRIIAPIPGKAAVGIEIPNRDPKTVYLREILDSEEFKDARLKLPLALGKTAQGKPFVADLTKMPHLLVAGATGSGKSVCMNVLISSLMYRLHPMQVKFIFIDPKMLELSVYSGIPHLARPVVTKPKLAEKVLADAVTEMENRYRRLKEASVRHIEDFNSRQKREEDKLPYIVVCIDELADLMMASQSTRTELLITRLAQMARAVGIHLVLATQRPSVDVITGLIKANFPARIAFQVSSKVDSRTIIDANGAEKLLGNGDMLYLAAGQPEALRVHGAFLSSEETERIVESIRKQELTLSSEQPTEQQEEDEAAEESDSDANDPLFKEACEVVIRHKQGSVSLLQRRLGIGYQRAARLIDRLEQAGVVSPYDGSKARDVLVDKSFLEALAAGALPRRIPTESK